MLPLARVLQRVLEQVAQRQQQSFRVDAQPERLHFHRQLDVAALHFVRVLQQHRIDQLRQRDDARLQSTPVDVRVREQVVDQRRHPQRAVADAREMLACLRTELPVHLGLEQMRESIDRTQRSLQVVRDGIGEAFQLVVRALQLDGPLADALLERGRQLAIARFAQPQLDVRRLQLLVRRHQLARELLRFVLDPRFAHAEDDREQDEQQRQRTRRRAW